MHELGNECVHVWGMFVLRSVWLNFYHISPLTVDQCVLVFSSGTCFVIFFTLYISDIRLQKTLLAGNIIVGLGLHYIPYKENNVV